MGEREMSSGVPVEDLERVMEVKHRVEALKSTVARLGTAMAVLGKCPTDTRSQSSWDTWRKERNRTKQELTKASENLRTAKTDLRRLSGTTGSDPKWGLIAEAYFVLEDLEEAGVDIGEKGHKLMDEIEFHVSPSRLVREKS